MSDKWPWFERHFNFDFPAAKMPDILERLRGTPARVDEMIGSIGVARSRRKAEGTWSIQENIGHLGDLEPLWIGRVQDILDGQETMREADLTNRKTHEASHHRRPMEETCRGFRSLRASFVELILSAGANGWTASALHPRLQTPMRIVDLAYFVAEHDDYHLARCRLLMGESK